RPTRPTRSPYTTLFRSDYDLGNGISVSSKTQYSTSDVERRVGTPTMGDANVSQDNYSNESKLTFGMPEDKVSGVAGVYVAFTDRSEEHTSELQSRENLV